MNMDDLIKDGETPAKKGVWDNIKSKAQRLQEWKRQHDIDSAIKAKKRSEAEYASMQEKIKMEKVRYELDAIKSKRARLNTSSKPVVRPTMIGDFGKQNSGFMANMVGSGMAYGGVAPTTKRKNKSGDGDYWLERMAGMR